MPSFVCATRVRTPPRSFGRTTNCTVNAPDSSATTRIVLPMHYWGRSQLERFMGLLAPQEPLFLLPDKPVIEVSKETLPEKLTVIAVGGEGGD